MAAPTTTDGPSIDEPWIDDDELAREALAADPDPQLGPDAVSLWTDAERTGDLPLWYMPAAVTRSTPATRRTAVVLLVVIALVVIVGSGLCITYGALTIA